METNGIDVDGLFTDDGLGDAPFDIPLQTDDIGLLRPQKVVPTGLVQHVDELHHCGSCQRVSWSKQGCVAILNPDALHVDIRCLRYSKKAGSWDISQPHPLFQDDFPFRISHIQWSPAGVDLAIADVAGRIALFTFSPLAVNRLLEVRPASLDAPDELNRPVAVFWLNQDRQRDTVLHSSKDDTRWTHIMAKRKPHGPYFARCTAVVTRKGSLRMIYQRPDQKWADATVQLNLFDSPDKYLTLAAFAPTAENKLLIVTHAYDGSIAVYRVTLTWTDIRQDPNAEFTPEFDIEIVEADVPNPSSFPSNGYPEQSYSPESFKMTHLDIVPTSDIEKTLHQDPTIFAVYTSTNNSVPVTSTSFLSSSIIRRWTVQAVDQKLHPRFDEITSKITNGTAPKPKTDVTKISPDKPFEQVITSIQQIDNGQTLAITTQDGNTTFWRSDTLAQCLMQQESNEATSLPQSGFYFPPNPFPLQMAFSPNACHCISLDQDGAPHLSRMQLDPSVTASARDDDAAANPNLDTALASIVLAFARACHSSANTDDLLACVQQIFRPNHITLLLRHMYRTLFRDVELVANDVPGNELSTLHTKSMVSKVLSFHAALGFAHDEHQAVKKQRDTAARLAWITLHVRHTAILFYFLMSVAKAQPGGTGAVVYHREFIDLLCSHAAWMLDLFKWMVDTIQSVVYKEENAGFYASLNGSAVGTVEDEDNEQEELKLITMLLTGVWSKYFLKLTMKLLLMTTSPALVGPAGPFSRILLVVEKHSRGQGLSMAAIEKMLEATTVHEGPMVRMDTRARREAEMMATGRVPDVYEAAVRGFRERTLQELRASGEMSRLKMFECAGDWGWVGMEDEGGKMVVDVHRKVMAKDLGPDGGAVGKGDSVRFCVRCGGLSEDFALNRDWARVLLQHMSRQMSRCVCEGQWVMEG